MTNKELTCNETQTYFKQFENYKDKLLEIRKYEIRKDGQTWLVGTWRYQVLE